MNVAVRDLKAKLSAYLKRASAGELITVTDRGRPIAILGPVFDTVDLGTAVEAGWVTAATATGFQPVRRHRSRSSVDQLVTEDRAE